MEMIPVALTCKPVPRNFCLKRSLACCFVGNRLASDAHLRVQEMADFRVQESPLTPALSPLEKLIARQFLETPSFRFPLPAGGTKSRFPSRRGGNLQEGDFNRAREPCPYQSGTGAVPAPVP